MKKLVKQIVVVIMNRFFKLFNIKIEIELLLYGYSSSS